MTKVLVSSGSLEGIADAIRAKNGSGSTYKPGQMAAAIAALPSLLVAKTITANGSYNPASDSADGYSAVTVNVPNSYAAGDEGKVVSNGALVAQTARSSEITANGTYDTTLNDEVTVNVSGGGATSLQFHLGRLAIDTGAITENNDYCYSDLIPISNSLGRWFLDLARSDTSSYYIGICFYDQDGTTQMGYIRQYETYRSYNNSSGNGAKYFRIANKVSNLSFASAVFCVDGIFVGSSTSVAYKEESV